MWTDSNALILSEQKIINENNEKVKLKSGRTRRYVGKGSHHTGKGNFMSDCGIRENFLTTWSKREVLPSLREVIVILSC
jgi:hypothetical protein